MDRLVVYALLVLAFLALVGLAWAIRKIYQVMKDLEDRLKDQDKDSLRLTHGTTAAHEDALAILMRLQIEENEHFQYRQAWINQTQRILQTSRQGPYAYDPDQTTYKSPRNVKEKRNLKTS